MTNPRDAALQTLDLIDATADTTIATATEIRANAETAKDHLADLRQAINEWPTRPTDPEILLSVKKGVTYARDAAPDRDKLYDVFGIASKPPDDQGFWANGSESLEVFPDGRLRMWFDRARLGEGGQNTGGSSWVNAALPLTRHASAARISYSVHFDPTGQFGWDWGTSGKLPGLMCWTAGRTPGGGVIGHGQHSARLAWSDWNRDGHGVRFGPYLYGQHKPIVPEQIWGPNRDDGTIRWGGPVHPEFTEGGIPDRPILVECDIVPTNRAGYSMVTLSVDRSVRWSHEIQLVDFDVERLLTHVSFSLMYGGDKPSYGPDQAITCLDLLDFQVIALDVPQLTGDEQ